MQVRPRDIEILSVLNRYKYLTSTALYRFTKDICRNEMRCLNRLTQLTKERYISRRDELASEEDTRYKVHDAVYQLESRGKAELLENGIEPCNFEWASAGLKHDFESCAAVSSIELASGNGVEFVPSSFFFERSSNDEPFRFKDVSIRYKGKSLTVDFAPDWPIFGLKYVSGNVLPIVGFETDRGTETNSPADLEHSSVLRHILCYDDLDRKGAFVGRFKLRNRRYAILIQTSSELRKRNMMKAIEAHLGSSEIFHFKVTPKFARFSGRSAPTAELLTTPWSRMRHPDVVLSQE